METNDHPAALDRQVYDALAPIRSQPVP